MAARQAFQTMGLMRFQHIGLQQRIVHNALQINALISQHMLIVF